MRRFQLQSTQLFPKGVTRNQFDTRPKPARLSRKNRRPSQETDAPHVFRKIPAVSRFLFSTMEKKPAVVRLILATGFFKPLQLCKYILSRPHSSEFLKKSFSGRHSFSFLFDTRFFVCATFFGFGKNTGFLNLFLESSQCVFKGFIFFYINSWH